MRNLIKYFRIANVILTGGIVAVFTMVAMTSIGYWPILNHTLGLRLAHKMLGLLLKVAPSMITGGYAYILVGAIMGNLNRVFKNRSFWPTLSTGCFFLGIGTLLWGTDANHFVGSLIKQDVLHGLMVLGAIAGVSYLLDYGLRNQWRKPKDQLHDLEPTQKFVEEESEPQCNSQKLILDEAIEYVDLLSKYKGRFVLFDYLPGFPLSIIYALLGVGYFLIESKIHLPFFRQMEVMWICFLTPLFAFLGEACFWSYIFQVNKKEWDEIDHELDSRESCKDTHGASRWSSYGEFSNQVNAENTGLVLAWDQNQYVKISESESFEHTIIVASTGAGKTQSFTMPNINVAREVSLVLTDPKGENFEKWAVYLKDHGYDVLCLQPFKEDETHFWNPLAHVNSLSDAQQTSETVMAQQMGSSSDPFWVNAASGLSASQIYALLKMDQASQHLSDDETYLGFENVQRLLLLSKEQLSNIVHSFKDELLEQSFNIYRRAPENTEGGIMSSLSTALQVFSNEHVRKVVNANNIDFNSLRTHKTALFIVIPDTKIKLLAPFMSLFYSQLFAFLSENSAGLPVHLYLDEFANMYIPNFDSVISTIRSRKVSCSIIIQDLSQLELRYGNAAKTILNNCKYKLFWGGLDNKDCKTICDGLGRTTIRKKVKTRSTSLGESNTKTNASSGSTNSGVTENVHYESIGIPLLEPSELFSLPSSKALLISKGVKRIVEVKRFYETDLAKQVDQEKQDRTASSELDFNLKKQIVAALPIEKILNQ